MSSVSTLDAKDQLSALINRAAVDKERVILTDRGKELVALVPIEDVHLLRAIEDRLDLKDALAAKAEMERDGGIPWEQVKAELGL